MTYRLISTSIKGGFASASGSVFQKDMIWLELDELCVGYQYWEITYSPSMGESVATILDAIKGQSIQYPTSSWVVNCHLSWMRKLQEEVCAPGKPKKRLQVQELDLLAPVNLKEDVQGLRLKAKSHLPEWVFSQDMLPKYLIVDYNGSADYERLISEIELVSERFPSCKLYLEQPFSRFQDYERLRAYDPEVHLIYDADDQFLARVMLDKRYHMVNLKIGRNTPSMYERLIAEQIPILFGNVLSTDLGENQLQRISDVFATVEVAVIT